MKKEKEMKAIVADPTVDHAGAMIKLMETEADNYVPWENSNPFPKSDNHLPSVASYFGGELPSHMKKRQEEIEQEKNRPTMGPDGALI